MSVVDDSRKVLQDLIAPDLQAIKAELKAIDDRSKLRDDALAAKIDSIDEKSKLRDEALSAKMDGMEERSKLREGALSAQIESKFNTLAAKIDNLAASINLDRRVEAIERKVLGPQPVA